MPLDQDSSTRKMRHGRRRGDSLDLREICSRVLSLGIEQTVVETGFVTQQQQTLGIHIQPPDWVDACGKSVVRKRLLSRLVWRELAKDAVGLMECDHHGD